MNVGVTEGHGDRLTHGHRPSAAVAAVESIMINMPARTFI